MKPGSARHRGGFFAAGYAGRGPKLVRRHGVPARIRVDNGPELINWMLQTWCQGQEIDLHWVQPASPTHNAYFERFNGSFRRELLNAFLFTSLRQVLEQC